MGVWIKRQTTEPQLDLFDVVPEEPMQSSPAPKKRSTSSLKKSPTPKNKKKRPSSRKQKRKKTPSFVLEVPLLVEPAQEHLLAKRFECARHLYNAVLAEGFQRLRLMQQSKTYQQARKMKKGAERTALFKTLREAFGFQEYALHQYLHNFKQTWVGEPLDADVAQKLAT
ncbi:MAG: helix-turn-helix domain-containing protein, partial [Myxococcota bacterium]